MEPIAIVTAIVAALYIVGRGPLIVAPTATAAFYRRVLSTPGRFRMFGVLLVLLGAALIVTARQAQATQGGITIFIEGFGWFTAAVAVLVMAAARPFQRLFDSFYAPPNEPLRGLGVLSVAFGLFWCFVTFIVW
jgi:uncharacterized protein YjeT (DUF2065 family)